MKRTYQTRINLANDQADLLDRFAELSGKVERTLYAQTIAQGKLPESVKNAYLKRFNMTSRQFNAVCRPLKGKVKSIKALRKNQIDELKQKIKKAESVIKKLSSKRHFTYRKSTKASEPKLNFKLHQKKRRLTFLNYKLERVQAKHKAGKVSLCFGSKKLFNAQHHLEANGYPSHSEWLVQWQRIFMCWDLKMNQQVAKVVC